MDDGRFVGYPIENHVYQLAAPIRERVYADWKKLSEARASCAKSFGELLQNGFGETLYELYFRPYNSKIWGCDIENVPASWLAGKFPMPTPRQMLEANERHLQENEFVHSSFYYPRHGGSQVIADTLAKGLSVEYDCDVRRINVLRNEGVLVNGERFDKVFFCGNVKELPGILEGVDIGAFSSEIAALPYHGTTAVFCETDPIPYSWFYQSTPRHKSHRFICTGNFSPDNNADGKMTCTVEFTDELSKDEIVRQLALMPFSPRYLCHHYSRYSYPIQRTQTRQMIGNLKEVLAPCGVHLVGRFAEWEYYNMDIAMESAMKEVECAGVRRL